MQLRTRDWIPGMAIPEPLCRRCHDLEGLWNTCVCVPVNKTFNDGWRDGFRAGLCGAAIIGILGLALLASMDILRFGWPW